MKTLSYKDTDKPIIVNIYGLEFKINNNIEHLDVEEIKEKANNNEEIIKDVIEDILGNGSVKKINDKRKEDGYIEMDLQVQIGVLSFLVQTYTDEVIKPINVANEKLNKINFRKRNNGYQRRNNRYGRY